MAVSCMQWQNQPNRKGPDYLCLHPLQGEKKSAQLKTLATSQLPTGFQITALIAETCRKEHKIRTNNKSLQDKSPPTLWEIPTKLHLKHGGNNWCARAASKEPVVTFFGIQAWFFHVSSLKSTIMELKSTITTMKNSLEKLKSKVDHAKERIMNLKDRSKK